MQGKKCIITLQKKNAVITNTDTREYNDKYISSDFVMSRGDYIFYDNMFWILWNQVNVKRAENYKAVMRQCEHNIIFNLYYVGVTGKYLLKCPAFIQRTSDYTNYWVSTVETLSQSSEVHVFVRDTAETRKIMDLAGKGDGQIIVGDETTTLSEYLLKRKDILILLVV